METSCALAAVKAYGIEKEAFCPAPSSPSKGWTSRSACWVPSWHRRDGASVTKGSSFTDRQKLPKVESGRDLRQTKWCHLIKLRRIISQQSPENLNHFELGQHRVSLYTEQYNTVKHHILIIINLVFMSAQIGYTKIIRKMQYKNDLKIHSYYSSVCHNRKVISGST